LDDPGDAGDQVITLDTYLIQKYNYDSIVAATFNSNDITKLFISTQIWFSYC